MLIETKADTKASHPGKPLPVVFRSGELRDKDADEKFTKNSSEARDCSMIDAFFGYRAICWGNLKAKGHALSDLILGD
ncbi:hypothetical protein M0R45_003235 [Rubus argutus]|uniref:Uncharacterized protein n=1 Tax=Rubus argutus TaxID=59490 RepID=A0AAW1YGC6_RUBAR